MSWWNDYVGIPYKDGGRERDGADCAGLVCLVYREQLKLDVDESFGFYDPDNREEASGLLKKASDKWLPVEPEDVKEFDVVRLKIYSDPCHVGIVFKCDDGLRVLNVRKGVNAVIEPLDAQPWSTRIDSFWRKPEVSQ